MSPEERRAFIRALHADRRAVEAALASFDARTAEATVEADRAMIFALISSHFGNEKQDAFDDFNETVRYAVRNAIAAFSWQI